MDSCGKHGNVQCRFFCTTCSVRVCHVCMERGDHVIPNHQCIPLSQYCEKKSNEVRTVLHNAVQHKTKYDQIRLKWDTHLSSLEGEFGKLKTEIRLTKQRLLQQMDLAEQSLLKTAAIAKTRKETAIKSAKVSHELKFSRTYEQLNEKCQSLLRKLSNQNFGDEHAFQECHNLLNTLQEELTNFDKENLLGINFTFVPSKTCFLGEVIAPKEADYIIDSELESPDKNGKEHPEQKRRNSDRNDMEHPEQKRKKTDTGTPLLKQGQNLPSTSKDEDRSSDGVNILERPSASGMSSNHYVNTGVKPTSPGNRPSHNISVAGSSTLNSTPSSKRPPNFQFKNPVTSTSSVLKTENERSRSLTSFSNSENKLPSPEDNLQEFKGLDSRCSGVVWVGNDWLVEISTAKTFITIKHHKISDRSQPHPNMNIQCSQTMEGVQILVCPKLYSSDYCFVVAFNDQVAIFRLKGNKGPEVTWRRIPKDFTLLAISWGQVPSKYVGIVKGKNGKISLMRDTSKDSGKPEFEVRDLSAIEFNRYHPFDISSNSAFAICNNISNSIVYFSGLGEVNPTKYVAGPIGLIDATPVSVMVRDTKREWLALWTGKSPDGRQFKWAIIRYDVNFLPLTTVTQRVYTNSNDEPKAFLAFGTNVAVLLKNMRIVFYNELLK